MKPLIFPDFAMALYLSEGNLLDLHMYSFHPKNLATHCKKKKFQNTTFKEVNFLKYHQKQKESNFFLVQWKTILNLFT